MSNPGLGDLPAPPGKVTGWPWTKESKGHSDVMPNGNPWPKISIVTPSYNQGEFIEETIRSVLLQGYPNLEYIVIDGGSTDNSKKILRKYRTFFTYWVSEKDRGQSHALNKGFKVASGEILAWLNSDDFYLPDVLFSVAIAFVDNPEAGLVIGKCEVQDDNGNRFPRYPNYERRDYEIAIRAYSTWDHFPQPSTFFRKRVFEEVGAFNEKLHYTMDLDYWIRIFKSGFSAGSIDQVLSIYRLHDCSKTVATGNLMAEQTFSVIKSHCGTPFEKGWWSRWHNCRRYESGHHVRLSRQAFSDGEVLSGLWYFVLSFKWPPEALRSWVWVRLGHNLGPRRKFRRLMEWFRS
ncbi:glycosyltransferase family 2 protein [Pseudomonadota bacterium]